MTGPRQGRHPVPDHGPATGLFPSRCRGRHVTKLWYLVNWTDDYDLAGWRDVYIQSDDGTPLEGWYIPATGGQSDKLVIFNHALPQCRAGWPGHLGEPWSSFAPHEIDFVIQNKHLADAGYNVLSYDPRNHGTSGAANVASPASAGGSGGTAPA